jgi:hypothetical protein
MRKGRRPPAFPRDSIHMTRYKPESHVMIKEPILVVDNAPYPHTMAPALVDLGYRVVSARNGTEGLREFETIRPPWVIVGSRHAWGSRNWWTASIPGRRHPDPGNHDRQTGNRHGGVWGGSTNSIPAGESARSGNRAPPHGNRRAAAAACPVPFREYGVPGPGQHPRYH